MRNKGFFWFLTILLTAVCLYQLSFTWVSNSVEKDADKAANAEVAQLIEDSKSNNGIAYFHGDSVDMNTQEGEEIAKAAIVNRILKEKAEKKVYPVFGSTFSEVKKRSLAFGLDLVGGMSVKLEISIPELVASYARNPNGTKFKGVYSAAKATYAKGGDFVDIFVAKNAELNKGDKLVSLFDHSEIEGLDNNSSDEDVKAFLKDKVSASMEGVEQIMNRRINQFGVAQPNIQRDPANNRLYIELPGVQDEVTVANQLQATANLQFFEIFDLNQVAPILTQVIEMSATEEGKEVDTTATEEPKSLTDEIESLNKNEGKGLAPLLQPYGNYAFAVLSKDRAKVEAYLNRSDIKNVIGDELKLMWDATNETSDKGEQFTVLYPVSIPVNGKARVGGKDIESAKGEINQTGEVVVTLRMTNDGAEKWGLMTSENKGRPVAITMDNIVYSAPNVKTAITDGNTEISGNFTVESANELAELLNGGALPAPCVIKEQTKVGPTIGAENSRSSLVSFGIALALVFAYMIFYYGKAGIVADIALLANMLFIFGSLASFGAVLTLAGIAGIVLTIGMAVDANVLIFERIREEEAAGKDKRSAIETGFKKALSSIIDANVTTMLTAIVLKVFGTGPIESFATTLIIGIFTSMFAALVISRLIIMMMIERNKDVSFDTKVTKGAFKSTSIDFVGKRKVFYLISGILVVGGLVALFAKGLNQSVEFTGGRTYGVKFEKSVSGKLEYLEKQLKSVMTDDTQKTSFMTKTKSNSYFVEITTNYMLGDESANAVVYNKLKEALETTKGELGAFNIEESRSVSPTVSEELKSSSSIAIVLSLIIIFAYILLRFGKWQYSTGAIVAMAHDVIIVLAVFSVFQGIMPFNMEIDQAFIAAILTVIGYSINDTVVVFDRIRENLGLHRSNDVNTEINTSLNSTLSRTINTSMTTFIVLLIIFIFGGAAIKGFIFALMIGVIVGTYSSICIATPILIDFSKKNKIAPKAE